MADSSTQKKGPSIAQILMFIVGGLVFLGLTFLVIILTSQKSGREFSPDDFTEREFSYAKVGWLNWTVMGITYDNTTTSFQQDLVLDGFITPVTNSPQTWHLILDSVSNTSNSSDFDAQILINYLDMPYWKEWNGNKKNKKKAKVLWPAVAALARNYAYWGIPDLMDLAIYNSDIPDAQFKAAIEKLTHDALCQCADEKVENGDSESAVRALTAAISIQPTKELLEARATAYDELDKAELAEDDRDAAELLASSEQDDE